MDVIFRSHADLIRTGTATFSPCEQYRYELTRQWNFGSPSLLVVMINPSKADHKKKDQTVPVATSL